MINKFNDYLYDRSFLIGRPNLKLKNAKCGNILCNKNNKFKKYKDYYICECGYILKGKHKIEEQYKIKLYCQAKKCVFGKNKMDKACLTCKLIGER